MHTRSVATFSVTGILGNTPAPVAKGNGVQLSITVWDMKTTDGKTSITSEWIPVIVWGPERVRIICEKWEKKDLVTVSGDMHMVMYKFEGAHKAHPIIGLQVGPDGKWQLLLKGSRIIPANQSSSPGQEDVDDNAREQNDPRQLPPR